MAETPIDIKAEILADLWMNYRDATLFEDFMEFNDLGLPVAYLFANQVVPMNKIIEGFIEETFSLLLTVLETEDTGFDSLADLIGPDFVN